MTGLGWEPYETPFGTGTVVGGPGGLAAVFFPGGGIGCRDADVAGALGLAPGASPEVKVGVAWLEAYFSGEAPACLPPLDWDRLGPATGSVLRAATTIPRGETVTYGELAVLAGIASPRAVGQALARNPWPIVVPCHRVLGASGLGGWSGPAGWKEQLLKIEGVSHP